MNTTLLRRARLHFCHDMAPRHIQRHNMREWCRAIRVVGSRWVMLERKP